MSSFTFKNRFQEIFLALIAATNVLSLASSSHSPPSHLSVASSFVSAKLQISTTSGTFLGTSSSSTGLETWLGVPYAQPPVGSLRFKAPQPIATPMTSVQNASAFGNSCPQTGSAKMGEDCLFLNVYRPQNTTAASKLPVFVWIHGGAFMSGSGSGTDPTGIIKYSLQINKPIIFVSINYRLNTFGFLATSTLPATDLNAGLQDQRMALGWIQDNIAAFGGDPQKVTIGGQSAGAGSVEAHLVYPPSNGRKLFRGAIEDSPTGPFKTSPPASTYDRPGMPFARLLSATGCASGQGAVDCLRAVPYQTLLSISNQMISATLNSQLWQPTIGTGGGMITEQASSKIQRGDVLDVPWLGGTNLNEGTSFASSVRGLNLPSTSQEDARFMKYIKDLFIDNSTISSSTMQTFISLYPSSSSSSSSTSTPKPPFDYTTGDSLFDRASEWYTDTMFLAPRRFFTQSLVSSGRKSPLWAYHFRDLVIGDDVSLGVTHGSELALLFGPVPTGSGSDGEKELELSNQMRNAWIGFVVDGKPSLGAQSVTAWGPYTKAVPKVLQLARGNISMIQDDFSDAGVEFINSAEVMKELQK